MLKHICQSSKSATTWKGTQTQKNTYMGVTGSLATVTYEHLSHLLKYSGSQAGMCYLFPPEKGTGVVFDNMI